MATPTHSNEALQSKRTISKTAKVIIFEISMVLGCVVAMFTVPRTTPLHTFLIICGGMLILGNFLLFRALGKPVDPARKVDKPRLYLAFAFLILYWVVDLLLKRK